MRTGEEKMKIRNGFVSNSSSSSFCIYGISIDKSLITEQDEIKNLVKNNLNADEVENFEEEDYLSFYEIVDFLEAPLNEFNLYYNGAYDWSETFIGRSWASLEDEETAGEFKKDVQTSIKEFFEKYLPGVEPDECQTHQEAWHD